MKKQRRFLVLLWVLGSMVLFSGGALAAATPDDDYSSHSLSSAIVTADSLANPGEQAVQTPIDESRKGGVVTGPPPLGSLVADFGVMGALCRYNPGNGWGQLATASSNLLRVGLGGKLIANFPGFGLYRHNGGNNWELLTPNSSVENLISTWGELYADFGPLGLWKYDGEWHNLSYSNPNHVLFRGSSNLVANFPGYGLYEYVTSSTWTQLTPNDTVQALIEVWPILYADFGAQGLWKYDGSWAEITPDDANLLGSYKGNLVANFPGHGLWQYDGATWTQLTPNDTVQALIEVMGKLYADYGALGFFQYDGSWVRITYGDANLLGSYGVAGWGLVANFPDYGGLYLYNGSNWTLLTSNNGITNMVQVSSLP
jgi:hypothetical protein